jgi:hypothetical protein
MLTNTFGGTIEIVGLFSNCNRPACMTHSCRGEQIVRLSTLLRLETSVVKISK